MSCRIFVFVFMVIFVLDTPATSNERRKVCLELVSSPKKYTSQVKYLFSKGLDEEVQTLGYHGTSVEALQVAVKTGFLPGGFRHSTSSGGRGLYLWLVKGDDRLDMAKQSAKQVAETHRLLTYLDLPWDQDMVRFGREVQSLANLDRYKNLKRESHFQRFLGNMLIKRTLPSMRRRRKFTDAEFREALLQAKARRGVVVGLNKVIHRKFEIITLSDRAGERFVRAPNRGISIDYITGIEPLGQEEWDYLSQLK